MSKKITSSASPKLTAFDQASVKAILADVEAVLLPIAEKYGLKLDRKGRSYHHDALPVMFQFLITKTDDKGNVLDADAQAFLRYFQSFGLLAEDLGREIQIRSEAYKIVGLQPRRQKFPVVIKSLSTGKFLLIPVSAAKRALGRGNDKPEHVNFTAGHSDEMTLQEWLDERKGHKITGGWKEEQVVGRGDDMVGPLILCDETEKDKDPQVTRDKGRRGAKIEGIPFGAKYLGETEWMSFADAHRLATTLGITLSRG